MNPFEMVLGIVLIGCVTGVIRRYLRVLHARELRGGDQGAVEGRLAKLETLEERVRTLEAIVTDRGYDLKREFENLRAQ